MLSSPFVPLLLTPTILSTLIRRSKTQNREVAELVVAIFSAGPIAERTRLVFFYGPTYYDNRIYGYDELDLIMLHSKFDANRTTAMYVHGFQQKLNAPDIQALVEAYNARDEQNLVVYDWSQEAGGDYFADAIPNAVALGKIMGTVVLNAIRKGLDVQKFHVVGHSLGAQLCGYMGRKIIQQSNHAVKLPRITGLEPANPGFFPPILLQHLSYSDADFVDIVHTDTNFYGQPHATGTADFWPNDGSRIQPGCPFGLFLPLTQNDLCSHQRSVYFYAESVKSPDTPFLAISARSWRYFKANDVNYTNVASMGIDCTKDAFGSYYLQTNGEAPYSRDISGIRFVN